MANPVPFPRPTPSSAQAAIPARAGRVTPVLPLTPQSVPAIPAPIAVPVPVAEPRAIAVPAHFESIDALRGFAMFWITGGTKLFLALAAVALPAATPLLTTQFNHSSWNGFTFYDLIFPLFLFVAGVSLALSLGRRNVAAVSMSALHTKIARRTALLFAIGVLHNGITMHPFGLRLPGVLQRIAITTAIASLLVLHTRVRTQVIVVAAILGGYALFISGALGGDLSTAGLLARMLDQWIVPFPQRWCCSTYGDSEGIFSTIPALATVLLGVLAGHWVRRASDATMRVEGLALAGSIALAVGTLWGREIAVNKYLWTPSYVLVAAGWSLLLLALFQLVIDRPNGARWGFIFSVIGANSIVMYLLEGVLRFGFLKGLLGTGALSLLVIAMADVVGRWGVLWGLRRSGKFLKL